MRVLRKASWREVEEQFYGHGGSESAARNARGWAARYDLPVADYAASPVWLEAWTDGEIRMAMDRMAQVEPRVAVDMVNGVNNAQLPPRVCNLPATLVRFGSVYGIIDGKHRMHQWMQTPGEYAVLVVDA